MNFEKSGFVKKKNHSEPKQALFQLTRFIRPYRKEALYALIALTIVVGFDLLIPFLTQRIIDLGIVKKDVIMIRNTAGLMILATMMSAILAITNNIFSVRVALKTSCDLRDGLFRKVQELSFGDIDHFQTGGILVRLTSDINQVQQVFLTFLRIGTRAPLLMIGSIIFLFLTNPSLASMMLIILPIALFVTYLFAVKLQPLFSRVQKKLDRLNTVLQENLSGIRVVKSFVRDAYENERFETANQDLMEKYTRVMQITSLLMPILTLLANFAVVSAIWFGGRRVIGGNMTVGQIVAFINYLTTTMFPLGLIAMAIGLVSAANASAERINEIFQIAPNIQDIENAAELTISKGRVCFENVSFQYNHHEQTPVLRDISFCAEAGKTIAILGATGSGKSTLLNLIPRLYDVSSGRITIDGIDIRHVKQESLWKQMGIVLQETILFSGSIADNIRFGNMEADFAEVVEAAKNAQAHEFIMNLADGYDSKVTQRGANLSGGQKQRIAIARALLMKPRILLLDDATSSVDVDTESKIQDALQKVMENCTSFVVAQRISTVLTADQILIMDRGEIVAQGHHRELIQSSPIYQDIFNSQLGNGGISNEPL